MGKEKRLLKIRKQWLRNPKTQVKRKDKKKLLRKMHKKYLRKLNKFIKTGSVKEIIQYLKEVER